MKAEDILTELYENFQDGKHWDKALKKIKEYVNQRVIEELEVICEGYEIEVSDKACERLKELKKLTDKSPSQ